MRSYTLQLICCAVVCIALCGCSSRIIKPDLHLLAPRLAAPSQPAQFELSYSIVGPRPKDSEDIDNTFRQTFAGHGISLVKSADHPAPATPEIVVYLLPAGPAGPGTSMPFVLNLVSFLALLPICEEKTYPVEFHVIGKGITSSSFRDQYIVRECQWFPTIFTNRDLERLQDEALRAIFDKAATRIAESGF